MQIIELLRALFVMLAAIAAAPTEPPPLPISALVGPPPPAVLVVAVDPTPEPPRTTPAATRPTTGCDLDQFTFGDLETCFPDWAAVIWCESRGDPRVYNQGGSGAAGLLQFIPSTWDSVARQVGLDHLVGVDPASQPATVQVAMADHLRWTLGAGLSPWECA